MRSGCAMRLDSDEVMKIRMLGSGQTLYVSDKILYLMHSVILSQ